MNNEIIISNHNPQDITITQEDNQLIFIDGGGSVIGITDVLVNGESVVTNNIAYVIVPTKTSELENDGNGYHPFITHETDPTVPSYVKAITRSDINNWNDKQDTLVSGTNIKTINNISLLGSGNINIESGGGTSTDVQINGTSIVSDGTANIQTKGAYNGNTNKIATESDIPTNTSDLNNDSNYVSSEDLSEVAFSGSYVSLSNVPTELSDFDNDLNFMTSSEVSTEIQTAISTKQDTLVSGTNIKTINNTSLLGSGNINIGSGGTSTDVQINGISITSNGVANIITESAYNSSTNKIATKNDIPTNTSQLTNDSNYAQTNVNNNFGTSQNINGMLNCQAIELSTATPYIDFHFNNSSSDYTSRIIEESSGLLNIPGSLIVYNGIYGNHIAELTSSSDYDNLTTSGYYTQNGITGATNAPTNNDGLLMVISIRNENNSISHTIQIFMTYSGQIWFRLKWLNVFWSAWTSLV